MLVDTQGVNQRLYLGFLFLISTVVILESLLQQTIEVLGWDQHQLVVSHGTAESKGLATINIALHQSLVI